MNIEVIINGKGSVTISQKVDVSPKTIRRLTAQAVELLTSVPGKGAYGFSGGTDLDTEVNVDG